MVPPSSCISWNVLPSGPRASISTGGNTPGTAEEARITERNSASARGPPSLAMAPMSHRTGRSLSTAVVATSRRRPLACSAATAFRSSGVTERSMRRLSGQVSVRDSGVAPNSNTSAAETSV